MAESEGFEPSRGPFSVVLIPGNPVITRLIDSLQFVQSGTIPEKCVHFVFSFYYVARWRISVRTATNPNSCSKDGNLALRHLDLTGRYLEVT
jgi:hypothetical protein